LPRKLQDPTKNKSQKVANFQRGKPPPKTPQLTTKSQQLHHKKPARTTHFPRNPLQKQQQKAAPNPPGRTSEEIAKTTSDF
jgi:hypothetical protein